VQFQVNGDLYYDQCHEQIDGAAQPHSQGGPEYHSQMQRDYSAIGSPHQLLQGRSSIFASTDKVQDE
jgi:hypothetical protein